MCGMIDILREIADACCDGRAQGRLKRLKQKVPKNLRSEADLSIYNPKTRDSKSFIHLRFFENVPKKKKESEYQELKQKPKYKLKKKQEDRAYEELLRKKERIRKAREKQLKAELSVKRKEKEDEKAKNEEERKKRCNYVKKENKGKNKRKKNILKRINEG